ncbi:MAG: hypothetical protein ACE5JK_08070, partial [Candidatus Omnitrophota bacterium]
GMINNIGGAPEIFLTFSGAFFAALSNNPDLLDRLFFYIQKAVEGEDYQKILCVLVDGIFSVLKEDENIKLDRSQMKILISTAAKADTHAEMQIDWTRLRSENLERALMQALANDHDLVDQVLESAKEAKNEEVGAVLAGSISRFFGNTVIPTGHINLHSRVPQLSSGKLDKIIDVALQTEYTRVRDELRGVMVWTLTNDPSHIDRLIAEFQTYDTPKKRFVAEGILEPLSLIIRTYQLTTSQVRVFIEDMKEDADDEKNMALVNLIARSAIDDPTFMRLMFVINHSEANKNNHTGRYLTIALARALERIIPKTTKENAEAFLNDLFKMMDEACDHEDDLSKRVIAEILKVLQELSVKHIARVLKINVKLARHLREAEHFIRLRKDDEFRRMMSEISYNLNREYTAHPNEYRLGEDEKTSLFDLLFRTDDITGAYEIFGKYFRNDPAHYQIDLQKLNNRLLGFFDDIADVKKLIQTVIEDPKSSLFRLTSEVRGRVRRQEDADEFTAKDAIWVLQNLFVLQEKIRKLEPIYRTLQEQGKDLSNLRDVLKEIETARSLSKLKKAADKHGLVVSDILKLKLESVAPEEKENILVSAFATIDLIKGLEARDELYDVLISHFRELPMPRKIRVYFGALFGANMREINAVQQVIQG